ncbi:MAG: alanine racemase [Acidobacteriota bacterium]|nr:alanine racemase [Acidobacteriota bacterium]MDH3529651.1 alanine racemase [Acidobacteriota bacterium]
MPNGVFRPTQAEINLANLVYNLRSVRDFVGKDMLYMAVVKADAYGHGAVECAQALERAGVDWFGVAIPSEGEELRRNGITSRILSLGGFWEGQEEFLLGHNITPVLFDLELARSLDRVAGAQGRQATVHIKIDTGMGRVGVPFDELEGFAKTMAELSNLHVEGMMTHYAAADDLSQNDFSRLQTSRFHKSVEIFSRYGMRPSITDLANSPGTFSQPDAGGNLVRLGGALYGLGDDVLPPLASLPQLKPVLSLTSRIKMVKGVAAGRTLGYGRTFETKRDSLIATIPIGYQDGYMRAFSNKADVLIGGHRVPVVGRVSMDWTLVDITDIPEAKPGDLVTLIGTDGGETVTAAELAAHAETISYEVTCGINRRVTRIFVD